MPIEILNARLYADRTVQNAHRTQLPRDADAIDVDLAGFCRRCKRPLYLIESTTNPEKATTYLRQLALAANVVALLVMHDEHAPTRWRLVAPTFGVWHDQEPWAYLAALRERHSGLCAVEARQRWAG